MEEDLSFLEEMSGMGLENITANEQAIPYLGMVQPDGSAAAEGATLGVWRNSATGEEYGNIVSVIPIAFKTIWNERENVSPFNTVGRYQPHGIEVTVQQPKNGKGYPKMINPETGNEVQELYIYAVLLAEHPEAGALLFNPTVGSMRTCKSWNTQLKTQLLPNGNTAPIFAYTWDLVSDIVDNPQKKGAKMARFVKVQKGPAVNKDLFNTFIKPQIPAIQQTVLSITQDTQDSLGE